MPRVELPRSLIDNLGAFGADGPRWAAGFQEALDGVLERWGLELEAPYGDLSYSFVARVRRGDEPLALKLGVPCAELTREMDALVAFAGRGVVRLLDADPARGALLLERVEPGTPLSSEPDDDRAMGIAAELMLSLWREPPPGHDFWSVARWGRAVRELLGSGQPSLLTPEELEVAHRTLQQPCEEGARRLLHADFHQLNVLQRADGSWVAIDAKGAVGDPCFEMWPLMTNCLDCDDPGVRMARRARRLARETGLDAGRILEWTVAGATLSLAWTLEDRSPNPERSVRKLRSAQEALRAHG